MSPQPSIARFVESADRTKFWLIPGERDDHLHAAHSAGTYRLLAKHKEETRYVAKFVSRLINKATWVRKSFIFDEGEAVAYELEELGERVVNPFSRSPASQARLSTAESLFFKIDTAFRLTPVHNYRGVLCETGLAELARRQRSLPWVRAIGRPQIDWDDFASQGYDISAARRTATHVVDWHPVTYDPETNEPIAISDIPLFIVGRMNNGQFDPQSRLLTTTIDA